MFDRLRTLLNADATASQEAPSEPLCVALLLMEMARADFDIAEIERHRIRQILVERYGLDAAAAEVLMRQAELQAGAAVSLFDYLKTLNARLDAPAKYELMKLLWKVAYADGRLDKYEEQLLRQLADLLYIPDKEFIRAKLDVIDR